MAETQRGCRWVILARRLSSATLPLGRTRRWVTRLLLQGPGIRTLDLGCGDGHYALAAARRGGYALGISNDHEALARAEAARDALGLSPRQAEFRCEDLRTWTAPPGEPFDQILLLAVLEHLLDDAGLLRRAHAALKPDGLLLVSVPNRACGLGERRARVTRHESGGHVRHGYTFEQLEGLLECCGFQPVDRRGMGWLGAQVVAGLLRALPGQGRFASALRVLLYPIWAPVAFLLDRIPTPEPYLILVVARRGVAP
jgi:SAM-dependent methyltransferase